MIFPFETAVFPVRVQYQPIALDCLVSPWALTNGHRSYKKIIASQRENHKLVGINFSR